MVVTKKLVYFIVNNTWRNVCSGKRIYIKEKQIAQGISVCRNPLGRECQQRAPNKAGRANQASQPRACIIKLITAVIYGFRNKLEFLSLASLSSLVQCFPAVTANILWQPPQFRDQYYKTFYGRNLLIFCNKLEFLTVCPQQTLAAQSNVLFGRQASFRCSTLVIYFVHCPQTFGQAAKACQ